MKKVAPSDSKNDEKKLRLAPGVDPSPSHGVPSHDKELRLAPGVDPSCVMLSPATEITQSKNGKRENDQTNSRTISRPMKREKHRSGQMPFATLGALSPGAVRVSTCAQPDDDENDNDNDSNVEYHHPVVAEVVDDTMEEKLRSRVSELENRLRMQESPNPHANDELHYDLVGFVGREKETQLLWSRLEALEAESSSPICKELVLVAGYSGVGKSKLADTLEDRVKGVSKHGIFARGKHDLNQRDVPCSGIAQALDHIFRTIGDNDAVTICQSIVSELGSEVKLLKQIVPQLKAILPNQQQVANEAVDDDLGYECGQEKWKYIFRTLTKVLCSHFSPLVLVLDDLQWSDILSLNVIEYIMTDTQNPNPLLIVGCYRSNEVDDSHALSKHIKGLEDKSERLGFEITRVDVSNLQLDAVNQVIMSMLAVNDRDETLDLAEICHRRTLGNPFFLIEFVTMLKRDRLIRFSMESLRWEWDSHIIEEATCSTDNMVDLLLKRMDELPKESQLLLEYASCLGASFDTEIMKIIWERHSGNPFAEAVDMLPNIYEGLEQENFIENRGRNKYAWIHDKVQEAALSLGEAASPTFQFEIGVILSDHLEGGDLDDCLFDVVDLLSKGKATSRIHYAQLYLQAARKAKNLSAFETAAAYVSRGLEMLPDDRWASHRALTVTLYQLGVEMELAAGHFEDMHRHSECVLGRKDCSMLEKLPIIYAQSHWRYKQVEQQDAIDYTLNALKDIGCSLIPCSALLPLITIRSFHRAVRKGKLATRDFYNTLPILTDEKEKTIMGLLTTLGYAAYFSKNELLYALSTSQAVERTLKYGVSEMSGFAFAALGITIQAITGDCNTASFFAETGLLLQKRAGSKFTASQCIHIGYAFSLSSTRPLDSLLPSFLEGYQCGMQSGNSTYALWCLFWYHLSAYQLGRPLPSIESYLIKCIALMEEMGERNHALLSRLFGQTILNLMGKAGEKVILKGDLFNSEECAPPTDLQKAAYLVWRLFLFIFFGDYEGATELAKLLGDSFTKANPGCFLNQEEAFARGLAFYKMARQSSKRKYKRGGKRILKKLDNSSRNGNPNVRHYVLLLLNKHPWMKSTLLPNLCTVNPLIWLSEKVI
mmetsp:Transcript_4166/g.9771  ORF Transcript_4166/g.9771 Transcript_4166/m.9771 type:complete len:1111 (+) Transcript_4166:329-3661(+)